MVVCGLFLQPKWGKAARLGLLFSFYSCSGSRCSVSEEVKDKRKHNTEGGGVGRNKKTAPGKLYDTFCKLFFNELRIDSLRLSSQILDSSRLIWPLSHLSLLSLGYSVPNSVRL